MIPVPVPTKDIEIILPSGVFARVRPITVDDMASCASLPHFIFMASLTARITQFDGQAWTPERVLQMDYDEAAVLFGHINWSLIRSAQLAYGNSAA